MINEIRPVIKENVTDLAKEGARIFSASALACVSEKGRFAVALSGGSTPRLMHRLLAEEPCISEIPWESLEIFWVDERCVPKDHPSSNFGTAKKDFIDSVPIPESHVYPMPAESFPEKGAVEYQRIMCDFFELGQGGFPCFDVIFLGIGTDGHTASLFPNHMALEEKERLAVSVRGGDPDVDRITVTLPVLNNARKVVFLVSGRKKAPIVKSVFEKNQVPLPAKRVRPIDGDLIWLLDREAASLLSKSVTYGNE